MANGYVSTPGDDYSALVEQLRALGRRLAELEVPTGTSVNSLVAQVQLAIANINTTVTAAIAANSYTQTQIDNKVSNPPSGSAVTGNVSATGTVTSGGNMVVGGQLLDPDAAAYNITGSRLTVWVETATGRLGNTSSSRKYKRDEAPAGISPTAILAVEPKVFHYLAEVRKRDDPTYAEYVGPDYVVANEFGFMAEDVAALKLPWAITHDGEPESVDYVMWVVALQIVNRAQDAQIRSILDRLKKAGL